MPKRIGLALSGGGIRAAIFHLGVLKYLASVGLFGQITSISSVSGAGLLIGAVFAQNGNRWPKADPFLRQILPRVRELILTRDIQRGALRRLAFSPHYWMHKAELLAAELERQWEVRDTLQHLSSFPYWEINCTTFETGGRFRIRKDFMGDAALGYTQRPDLPISHMMAASAGFPVLIGPYTLYTRDLRWTADKLGYGDPIEVAENYSLWDGGIYDNLGLEALYKTERGLDSEIDYLIVSNASAPIAHQQRRGNFSLHNTLRLLDIALSQADQLRIMQVHASVMARGKGMILNIGESAGEIAQSFGFSHHQASKVISGCLSPAQAMHARDYPTTLRAPSREDFDLIMRHGFESAMCAHSLEHAAA